LHVPEIGLVVAAGDAVYNEVADLIRTAITATAD
jgi:hypothetical protein